jgi:hypothetical protein
MMHSLLPEKNLSALSTINSLHLALTKRFTSPYFMHYLSSNLTFRYYIYVYYLLFEYVKKAMKEKVLDPILLSAAAYCHTLFEYIP